MDIAGSASTSVEGWKVSRTHHCVRLVILDSGGGKQMLFQALPQSVTSYGTVNTSRFSVMQSISHSGHISSI